MSYRKITVDNIGYEYVIGTSHVKVKGVGVWPKDSFATAFHLSDLFDEQQIEITPKQIADQIRCSLDDGA